ncbi:hypothetical protein [Vulcanisaeta distributa]|uniref:Uncharacterized protein n=1 Tax=Vulcanisaeta distributa (strain DSM 14429 / JCM 11212 / NBRC 100878 / IC-017) TaxID=572478 RepID=E1QSD4_VULDI|nr:hypothetical protein [Vulcanisaeta distributa]ADN49527.1 hypothetical protein Vdis_0114 [Vulcanisaeta distributa DSM 14429]
MVGFSSSFSEGSFLDGLLDVIGRLVGFESRTGYLTRLIHARHSDEGFLRYAIIDALTSMGVGEYEVERQYGNKGGRRDHGSRCKAVKNTTAS